MTAGIQIINDYGTVLIDENYSNLCVRASGSCPVDSNGVFNPGPDTTYQGVHPMFVVGGNHTYRNANCYFNADGTVHGYATAESVTPGGYPSYYAPYWFFDVPPAAHTSGLVVYKSDGSVAFDAMNKYARVVDVITGTTYTDNNGTHTYPAGRTYGICIIKASYKDTEHTATGQDPDTGATVFGTVDEHWYTTFQINNNQLIIGNGHTIDEFDPNGLKGINYTSQSLDWAVAVLDMTGY